MKKIQLRISTLVLLVAALVGFHSCTEDGGGIGGDGPLNPLAPFVQFLDESNAIIGDTEVLAGEIFRVKLDVQRGDNDLKSLAIREDGDLVATARLEFNSGFTTVQNPYLVTGTDVDGFEIIIDIEAHNDGVRTYSFIIEDEAGETDQVSLDISIGTTSQPIDSTFTMILLNNADGQSPGALDLDVPEAVSSSSSAAEIRDQGIDLDMSLAENWIQRVEPVNGATLAMVDDGNVDFDAIATKGEVKMLYDNGNEVSETPQLAMGDIFVVKSGTDYFLLVVQQIILTPDDNTDYYEFDIKQAFDVE